MNKVRRSEAIKKFLELNTWPELAAMYNSNMEVQVNVAQDGGERVDRVYKGRDYRCYTDGIQTWKSFRMPLKAMSDPQDNNYEMDFDLSLHVEAIGMTGWDWIKRKAQWVAFDFDSLIGHSEKHQKKLSESELEEIKDRVKNIEWVTLRRSTGGQGLHIYVFIGFEETLINHNEHMALGRAILSQLSAVANFDFESKVDANSGNMWVWHRKMIKPDGTRGNGLELLKSGGKLDKIPANWKDYIDVVKGKRRRTVPFFIRETENPEKAYDEFEELSNQRTKVQLDNEHRKLIDWIEKNTGGSWWHDTHWMLVTHTYILKLAHQALGLRGIYDTISQGTELGSDFNCYAFPMVNGAWSVRRYTRGVQEHNTWMQDGQGWTYCYFNRYPTLKMVCQSLGGVELTNGGFSFPEARTAIKAAEMLGTKIALPEKMHFRSAILKQHKDKRLIIEIEKQKNDSTSDIPGFDGSKPKSWTRIYDVKQESGSTTENLQLDRLVRHIVNEGGRDEGWVVRNQNKWVEEPLQHVTLILRGEFGFKPNEIEQILGTGAYQPYTLVNRPFDDEYPPGRLWNRRGAKLRFAPSQDVDNLNFPTWIKIFEHLGKNLTPYLINNPWAKAHNILNGCDYLLLWAAGLLQKPYERLPFLFFYSKEQNTGKSTFHEALMLLMGGAEPDQPPSGYMKVNEALRAQQQFNAELHHAILCVVEELDLNPARKDAKISYNRIKELVTAPWIGIHEKRQTPCMVRNTTHWVQCSNEKNACPIFQNDSRVTMIKVDPIDEIDIIPKSQLLKILESEAPDFLAYILKLELPSSNDRLIVPVIETEEKKAVQAANLSLIEQFISENCYAVDGEMILWADFYDKFARWLEPGDLERWTKRFTGMHLPDSFPRARNPSDAHFYIGNISFSPKDPNTPIKPRLTVINEYLKPNGQYNGQQQDQRSIQDSGSTTTGTTEVST